MRLILSILSAIAFVLISGCRNNPEDIGVDCSSSGLSLSVISSIKSDCDVPGSIEVEAKGGEEPYEYSINGSDLQNSGVFNDLFAGTYTITVTDDQGCTAEVGFTLESEPTGITLNLTSSKTTCGSATGSVEAEAIGGTGTFTYAIGSGQFSESGSFSNLSQGTYEVTAKDEENCTVTKSIGVKTNTSLSADIMPIIQADCAINGCHNGSQPPLLITNQEVIDNAGRIKSETQAGSMPRNRTLSDKEIDLIACWVDDGPLNN